MKGSDRYLLGSVPLEELRRDMRPSPCGLDGGLVDGSIEASYRVQHTGHGSSRPASQVSSTALPATQARVARVVLQNSWVTNLTAMGGVGHMSDIVMPK